MLSMLKRLSLFGLGCTLYKPLTLMSACVCGAVLTWAVYCLSVNTDIQAAARQEVKRVCSETGDITPDDVDNMT